MDGKSPENKQIISFNLDAVIRQEEAEKLGGELNVQARDWAGLLELLRAFVEG